MGGAVSRSKLAATSDANKITKKPDQVPNNLINNDKPFSTVASHQQSNKKTKFEKDNIPCKNVTETSYDELDLTDEEPKDKGTPIPLKFKSGKQIVLSSNEKSMKGAPEGDIFEMIVLENQDLLPFHDDAAGLLEYNKLVSVFDTSALWAEKYDSITILRRIVLHHDGLITSRVIPLSNILRIAIEGVESLRSCTVRNSLMCIDNIIGKIKVLDDENSYIIISSLLKRSSHGPKFICEQSYQILMEATNHVSKLFFIQTALEFGTHKNAEVVARAVSLGSKCIQQLTSNEITELLALANKENKPEEITPFKNLLELICMGVNSKRSLAKEGARDALRYLTTITSCTSLEMIAMKVLTASKAQELKQTMKQLSGKTQLKTGFDKSIKMVRKKVPLETEFVVLTPEVKEKKKTIQSAKNPVQHIENEELSQNNQQILYSTLSDRNLLSEHENLQKTVTTTTREQIQKMKRLKQIQKTDSVENVSINIQSTGNGGNVTGNRVSSSLQDHLRSMKRQKEIESQHDSIIIEPKLSASVPESKHKIDGPKIENSIPIHRKSDPGYPLKINNIPSVEINKTSCVNLRN